MIRRAPTAAGRSDDSSPAKGRDGGPALTGASALGGARRLRLLAESHGDRAGDEPVVGRAPLRLLLADLADVEPHGDLVGDGPDPRSAGPAAAACRGSSPPCPPPEGSGQGPPAGSAWASSRPSAPRDRAVCALRRAGVKESASPDPDSAGRRLPQAPREGAGTSLRRFAAELRWSTSLRRFATATDLATCGCRFVARSGLRPGSARCREAEPVPSGGGRAEQRGRTTSGCWPRPAVPSGRPCPRPGAPQAGREAGSAGRGRPARCRLTPASSHATSGQFDYRDTRVGRRVLRAGAPGKPRPAQATGPPSVRSLPHAAH